MDKKQVQQRVLQNGKPLALSKFTWDKKTRTFASLEDNLVVDFAGIDDCTFTTGYDCTFDTGGGCTFTTGGDCTFTTGYDCTFKTGWRCTFDTGWRCTFKTGCDCTFKTGWRCTFKTGSGCTFKTGSGCTFDTWNNCTFDTGSGCTFKTGVQCVIARRDVFEVIQPQDGETIKLCPYGVSGYLTMKGDDWYNADGEECVIADGILSKVVSKKNGVYRVINHGQDKQSYLIERDGCYAHGDTLKEAKESLRYKITERDTSRYEGYTLETKLSLDECITMYRTITGACARGS